MSATIARVGMRSHHGRSNTGRLLVTEAIRRALAESDPFTEELSPPPWSGIR
ncbi:hypothetical protein RBSWK_02382 [Rhodopirellula baltica SWK14]|uniref:Uncharacterized protein n=1 Tax=Rhodopirellula baltica SWK14 TaxID=993516 RepID=L7CHE6_RHOBT|nr:hypothetical protein RBSWK_02382 [Rhodopirellula baltica SWK14]